MLNKEQILRKKIRTTARCDISVKRQLQEDYYSVMKKEIANAQSPSSIVCF